MDTNIKLERLCYGRYYPLQLALHLATYVCICVLLGCCLIVKDMVSETLLSMDCVYNKWCYCDSNPSCLYATEST